MARIVIEIENCYECPNAVTERYYTEDSFEIAWTYRCKKTSNIMGFKKIADYIERRSDMPEIPDWCPLLDEQERADRNHKRIQNILDMHGGKDI